MNVMNLQAMGRTGLRPHDLLTGYKIALTPGGIRHRIYETILNRAMREGRIPSESLAVLEEIKTRLKNAIKETIFQTQIRLGKGV